MAGIITALVSRDLRPILTRANERVFSLRGATVASEGRDGGGGFPNQKSVTAETRGHFSSRFSGCLKELSWNKNYIVTDFSRYTGENIGSCDLGHG
uniref:Uncharacterized protein n=1 Tax=Timema douglasi TaxID=61478 RepID=A0A7R8VDT5_TIMDO|nr:unnamed protein product [Timema douglasi]